MSSPVAAAHTRAVSQLALAALFWSLGGLLIKSVAWPALAVSGGRGLIAALFLLFFARGFSWKPTRPVLLGALAYAVTTMSFVAATKMTTAANAILLQYTAPIWIALFGAWLLGERATRVDWMTIAVVLGGMGLFLADGLQMRNVAGNLMAIFSGVAFAALTMALRHQKDGRPLDSIIWGNLIAFVCGLPWILRAPMPDLQGCGALLLLGVVQLGISYLLLSKAIRHVTALEAVLIPVIEPLLNPVWVFLAKGERPSLLALGGGALVLVAVTLRAIHGIRCGGAARRPVEDEAAAA